MISSDVQRIRNTIGVSEADAAKFERLASGLLLAFSKGNGDLKDRASRWTPDRHVTGKIDESMFVGPLVRETPDQKTFEIIALDVYLESGHYSLDAAGCTRLAELSHYWADHPRLSGLVTPASMRDRLKDWCFDVLFSNQFHSSVDYILKQVRSDVDLYEVWVQLADIDVQDSFPMGLVSIRGISPDTIDEWMCTWDESSNEEVPLGVRENLQENWQGHTAAVYCGIGDREAVQAFATEHAERACAAIRLVEPGNQSTTQRSYLQPLTLASQMGARRILANPASRQLAETAIPVTNPPCGIVISRESFPRQWADGKLRILHEFLSLQKPTAFQQHLLRALLIYTRQRLSSDPVEKLIFAFSGVETMLLGGDEKIGIRFALKKRMAAFLAGTKEYRDHIARIVNDAYNLRSGFLHHGKELAERRAIELFLQHSWIFFWRIIDEHERWDTIVDCCGELDGMYERRFGAAKQ